MEAGNGDDPLCPLEEACSVSDSQEERLRYCSFAYELDSVGDSEPFDYGRIHVESDGIVMVSPPESLETSPHDMYQTPPEGSVLAGSSVQRSTVMGERRKDDQAADETLFEWPIDGVVAVDGGWTEGTRVVDLGRDSELEFSSEVQLTQISNREMDIVRPIEFDGFRGREVPEFESHEFEVSREECLTTDSPLKRLKISEKYLGLVSPRDCTGPISDKSLDDLTKSSDSLLKSGRTPPDKDLVENNTADEELGGSSKKRKLKLSDNSRGNYDGETDFTRSEKLNESGEASDELPRQDYRKVTILDVMKMLKEEDDKRSDKDNNDSLANLSVLDILKRGGMTFPRPSWW